MIHVTFNSFDYLSYFKLEVVILTDEIIIFDSQTFTCVDAKSIADRVEVSNCCNYEEIL